MPKTNTVYLLITRFNHADVCTAPVWRNWGKLQTAVPNLFTVKVTEVLAIISLPEICLMPFYIEFQLGVLLGILKNVICTNIIVITSQTQDNLRAAWTSGWELRLQKPKAKANIWCSLMWRV